MTLNKRLPEIHRVLKPGGRAAFCEPLGHNVIINAYRFIKHHYIEKYLGTDQPFKLSDKETFEQYFETVTFVEGVFIREKHRLFFYFNNIFLHIPFLRRYASYVTILLQK